MTKRSLPGNFASALLGGTVTAVIGLSAIATGVVELEDEAAVVVPAAEGAASTLSPASEGDAESLSVNDIYEKDAPGVVFIEASSRQPSSGLLPGGPALATGSGFVIDEEGRILTNAHVVGGADTVRVTLSEDADPIEARVLGTDPSTDVAVLEVDASAEDLHPLELGSSADVGVGDAVVAIGNPFGLDRTVTAGIVSAIQRQIPAPDGYTITDAIQTDAAINPGNSGGPLLDAAGRAIGINSQIETGGGSGNVGIGFAVPIDTAREVANQLIAGGEAEHAFIGVSVGDTAQAGGGADGALVGAVTPGGPAEQAGIERGDVITSIAGAEIADADDLITAISAHAPGDEVEVGLARDGQAETVTVTLGDRPAGAA